MAAVIYTNRANAQLQLGRAHAAGALADSLRAASLSPGYVKALHWKAKAQDVLCPAAAEHVHRLNPAAWSLHSALKRQAVRLVGKLSKSCFPTLCMRLLPCKIQPGLLTLQTHLLIDGSARLVKNAEQAAACTALEVHAGDGCHVRSAAAA